MIMATVSERKNITKKSTNETDSVVTRLKNSTIIRLNGRENPGFKPHEFWGKNTA